MFLAEIRSEVELSLEINVFDLLVYVAFLVIQWSTQGCHLFIADSVMNTSASPTSHKCSYFSDKALKARINRSGYL